MFSESSQAAGLNCSCHAAQASKMNFQKTCYKTFSSTCRPRLYVGYVSFRQRPANFLNAGRGGQILRPLPAVPRVQPPRPPAAAPPLRLRGLRRQAHPLRRRRRAIPPQSPQSGVRPQARDRARNIPRRVRQGHPHQEQVQESQTDMKVWE